ncbi:MAG: class I SAM-dependent methyltransferase [Actinobacteria bacterium]|nr:class I SAM-dependent methyltransferase [Actinomycetota bacterium]
MAVALPHRRRRRPAGTASPRRSRSRPRPWSPTAPSPPRPTSDSSTGGGRPCPRSRGSGHNAVNKFPVQQGAKVIAVDPSAPPARLYCERAERAEVRVELHQGGLAELAFLRSDSVDAALSVMALASVDDVDRVFRQVHRVLKPQAPFVCSFPHPAFAMFDPTAADPLRVARPYDQSAPLTWDLGPDVVTDHPRTVGELFTALNRASFLVDQLLEPTAPVRGSRSGGFADAMTSVPATLVLRGRKQGN